MIEENEPVAVPDNLNDMTDEQLDAIYYGDEEPTSEPVDEDVVDEDAETDDDAPDVDETDADELEDDPDDVDDDLETDEDAESSDRVLTLDEFAEQNEDLRIDTGDGVHKLSDLFMRHRDVQIAKQKLAEERKELETLKPSDEDMLLVNNAKAIQMRLQTDAAGLGLDAIRMGLPDAYNDIVQVLANHGWNADKGALALAQAQLQTKEQPEPSAVQRKGSEVLVMRDQIETLLKHEFNDTQWNVIYANIEARESAGETWQDASEAAISKLYPNVMKQFHDTGKPTPKKRKPSKSVRPGGKSNAAPKDLNSMSDKELDNAWKSASFNN